MKNELYINAGVEKTSGSVLVIAVIEKVESIFKKLISVFKR